MLPASMCVFAFFLSLFLSLCHHHHRHPLFISLGIPFVVLHTFPLPSFPLPARTPTLSAAAPQPVRLTFPPRFILSLTAHAPLPRIPLAILFLRTSVPRILVLWVKARLPYGLFKCLCIPPKLFLPSYQLHTVWLRHSEARIDSCAHISTRS
ncbi:hypothetical protein B0H11DRAFT_1953812 [Mycena galericulata]|nr:hypothetical protein B0H11DRAFT_1953812 [Mycena galericulata]